MPYTAEKSSLNAPAFPFRVGGICPLVLLLLDCGTLYSSIKINCRTNLHAVACMVKSLVNFFITPTINACPPALMNRTRFSTDDELDAVDTTDDDVFLVAFIAFVLPATQQTVRSLSRAAFTLVASSLIKSSVHSCRME